MNVSLEYNVWMRLIVYIQRRLANAIQAGKNYAKSYRPNPKTPARPGRRDPELESSNRRPTGKKYKTGEKALDFDDRYAWMDRFLLKTDKEKQKAEDEVERLKCNARIAVKMLDRGYEVVNGKQKAPGKVQDNGAKR